MGEIISPALAGPNIRIPIKTYAAKRTHMPAHRYRYCSETDVIVTTSSVADAEHIKALVALTGR